MCIIFPFEKEVGGRGWIPKEKYKKKQGEITVYLLSIKTITILFSGPSSREAKLKDYYIVNLVNIFSNFIALKVHII